MSNKFNYIIVGQGLAGTCLAIHLQNLGQKVMVIDKVNPNSSSRVAAGLFNPITGRKMVLTWKAHLLFSYMNDFYSGLEKKLNTHYYHNTTIYRPFVSLEEQNEWMGKSTQKEYSRFIERVHTTPNFEQDINDQYGGLALANCGYLDIPTFLNASRKHFINTNSLLDEVFDFTALSLNNDVGYRNLSAQKIIFCTGPESLDNPYFHWLPFNLVKGEVLEIAMGTKFETIYNRGVFIMPRKEDKYIVGATYNTKDLSPQITEVAKNTLIEKLSGLLKHEYKIIGQRAGIRPATKDRRPLVGMHPEMKQIGVFNGLGTKGVTLAPYFANHFAECLVNEKDVEKEVNINRYYSLYYHHSI